VGRSYPSADLFDPTFDGDGRRDLTAGVIRNVTDTAVQPDGKIVAVGSVSSTSKGTTTYCVSVVRMNPDDSLDTTFSGDGVATVSVKNGSATGRAIALQPDGKIVVGGLTDAARGQHQLLVESQRVPC
jgi:uncharacterized delta-60 repeat protein